MSTLFINNKDVKEMLLLIGHKEGLSQQDILNAYNKQHNKNMSKASFSQMINRNTFKYNILVDVLESIGYCIEIKKKL